MSWLRAKCPDCRTLTAVSLDNGYQCHMCGREFEAGLVRVPRAFGVGGEPMAAAAWLELPYPETAVVACETLEEQIAAQAASLPPRPLVLGGCCCAHVGAIRGLSARGSRLAVVWVDAHGDLNTPESSPSGNAWGMPLRMAIDEGSVRAEDVALVGVRQLDAAEAAFMEVAGIDDDVSRALDGADMVYVALDCDVLEPEQIACFMPEPGGLSIEDVEAALHEVGARRPVAGAGLTGLLPEADPALLVRFAAALGL